MNIEQERAQFEAWYRLHHGSLNVYGRDASGEYADKQVQGAFNVWQARAALAAPAAPQEPSDTHRIAMEALQYIGDYFCESDEGDDWHLKHHALHALDRIKNAVSAAQAAPPVVAWLAEDGSDAWTGEKKRAAVKHAGAGGKALAAKFSIPLGRIGAEASPAVPLIARALAEWHEDDGPVMWWAWCGHEWAGEPPWCGTPLDSDWPGYHTHWTPMVPVPAVLTTQGASHE